MTASDPPPEVLPLILLPFDAMKPTTLLCGLLVLSGCASAGAATNSAAAEIAGDMEIPVVADARGVTGTWRGTYVCAQGLTALELALTGHEDGRVEGTFAFSEAAGNPGVPSGSYRVHGVLSAGLVLRLDPGEWIRRPRDYFPVALVGRVEQDASRYYGFVDGWSCGTFAVSPP